MGFGNLESFGNPWNTVSKGIPFGDVASAAGPILLGAQVASHLGDIYNNATNQYTGTRNAQTGQPEASPWSKTGQKWWEWQNVQPAPINPVEVVNNVMKRSGFSAGAQSTPAPTVQPTAQSTPVTHPATQQGIQTYGGTPMQGLSQSPVAPYLLGQQTGSNQPQPQSQSPVGQMGTYNPQVMSQLAKMIYGR